VKSPEELTARFRDEGRKVTPQRQRIFAVLDGHRGHPTAEAVWEQVRIEMPTVSLKTVYQTLHDLAEMGEVRSLDLGTGSTRFDPNVSSHQHLVCDRCGRVQDLVGDFAEVRVPDGAAHGFQISSTEIVFRGRCPECATSPGGD
jgi:Fe2+ or Zn2+ uptake regulation protein